MKQVRFANNSSSSVPAVLTSSSEPGDGVTTQQSVPVSQDHLNLGPQLKLLPLNDQVRELQTIIRDK